MAATFSLVYPTRDRPGFIRQALRILELQAHASFEVIVSDNYTDRHASCEEICRNSALANLTYVRPPRPVGMVENWNHALQFATGQYVCFLTDKMFFLPNALVRIERAIDRASEPEIVSWTSDGYDPVSYADYFGDGMYVRAGADFRRGLYRAFSPRGELDRRGRAEVSRGEQRPSDYCRGKLVFGAYRRDLVQRVVTRYDALFHNISPDYTSMILGLTEAHDAIELSSSCVVSVNSDLSNGMLADRDDSVALGFLQSLGGRTEDMLYHFLVPGLYVSQHNMVAHDFLTLKRRFDLSFDFEIANWIAYCHEDVYRPGRQWSDARVEADQKALLSAFVDSLEPDMAAAVRARLAARAERKQVAQRRESSLIRRLRRRIHSWRRADSSRFPSLEAAVTWASAGGRGDGLMP